jgi:manganese efflux pump family protein
MAFASNLHRKHIMHLLTILGIAVALAMDAFAVAIATGVSLKQVSLRQTFRLSWHFGLFQALMPIIGWALGSSVQSSMEAYAHWVAFVLLALVGTNMLKEAILADEDEEEAKPKKDSTKGMTLVMLSVATSIDALAVGLSMSMLRVSIMTPALVIGIVAGMFTVAGLHLGKRVARLTWLSTWAEIVGGLVLWLIGLNILRENGAFEALF